MIDARVSPLPALFRFTLTLALLCGLIGCGSALSTEQEIAIGEQNAPVFLQQGGGPIPDAVVQAYVSNLGAYLLEYVDPEVRRGLPWSFNTLDSGVLNAFALPGGKVFVTRALMSQFTTEGELAGVLGHEIGHVIHEHIGKQMTRATWINVGIEAIGIATESNWGDILGSGAGQLYLLKFGRGQELEADEVGMNLLARAGYDPADMIRVMEVLRDAGGGGGTEWLSTHPHPETRIEQAQEMLAGPLAGARGQDNAEGTSRYRSQVLDRFAGLGPPNHSGE